MVLNNSVGVPQIVPLVDPRDSPSGKVALISHEVISPAPVISAQWQISAHGIIGQIQCGRRVGDGRQLIDHRDVEVGHTERATAVIRPDHVCRGTQQLGRRSPNGSIGGPKGKTVR